MNNNINFFPDQRKENIRIAFLFLLLTEFAVKVLLTLFPNKTFAREVNLAVNFNNICKSNRNSILFFENSGSQKIIPTVLELRIYALCESILVLL